MKGPTLGGDPELLPSDLQAEWSALARRIEDAQAMTHEELVAAYSFAPTGQPRLMVTTADTCVGPRAYVGVVSSYYEPITDGWQRLTDSEWSARVTNPVRSPPDEVRWMTDLIVQ